MQTVVLKTFDDYFSANILLTRLQHEGIPCYLFDEHTVTVNPIFGAVIGGIKLVVSKGYEEAAKRLINRFEEEYQQQVLCPKCFQHKFNLVARQSPENIFYGNTYLAFWQLCRGSKNLQMPKLRLRNRNTSF